jgi:hypothetical protein
MLDLRGGMALSESQQPRTGFSRPDLYNYLILISLSKYRIAILKDMNCFCKGLD